MKRSSDLFDALGWRKHVLIELPKADDNGDIVMPIDFDGEILGVFVSSLSGAYLLAKRASP